MLRQMTILYCGLLSLFLLNHRQGVAQESDTLLRDKTLVSWVYLDNLDQRGGSALTIEDRSDQFDAIVFGEKSPRTWMAGSDFYKRTLSEQSDIAKESLSKDSLVQIAIVYQGNHTSIYRNGNLISSYETPGEPLAFSENASIVIGKRHSRQGGDDSLAGQIEDARIYSIALTSEQIAALEPNVESKIQPWAWWNFEDNKGLDVTGRFLQSRLYGEASIRDGKLHLHGPNANFVAKSGRVLPFRSETPTRPTDVPPHWLSFHLAHPGPGVAVPGDPNCAFYWKGRYHLHYIYKNEDGFVFAHISSDDLLHWKWHPTTLTPTRTGHGMFSGTGFYTKEGRPAIIYHGEGSGRNQIAIAQDDNLEQWSTPEPLEPIVRADQDGTKIANWDPDCWVDGDSYYALSGGSPGSGKPPTLFKSNDLQRWDYLGLFLTRDMPDVRSDEDISCPNFFKIGDRDMLLCISHTLGCRYYLGKWEHEKFTPDFHARMNWHGWDFFAPESLLAADGRRVMWAWCNLGEPQSGIQSLPRELSLPADGVLRIKPLQELEQLRVDELVSTDVDVDANQLHMVGKVGKTTELVVESSSIDTRELGIIVNANADGSQGLKIVVAPQENLLRLGELTVPFELLSDKSVRMKVYIDQNMIEVFVNDRQAAVTSFPSDPQDSYLGVLATEKSAKFKIEGWRINSIY